jgi:hypothetical protein
MCSLRLQNLHHFFTWQLAHVQDCLPQLRKSGDRPIFKGSVAINRQDGEHSSLKLIWRWCR